MAIVQDVYDIPDDLKNRMGTGELNRTGSVIRYGTGPNKGQIVKHLKPVDLKAADGTKGIGTKVQQFVKQHRKGAIIIVSIATVAGGSVWLYRRIKNREPKVVSEFKEALGIYIEAIRKGDMDLGKIDNLMTTLEKLKEYENYEKINIQLTAEELEVLVGNYENTLKLAEDNGITLYENELDVDGTNVIVDLQTHLETQKRIFEETA